jgi:uncharacterized protein (TIGR01319 family)
VEDLNRDFSEHPVSDEALRNYIEQISCETASVPQAQWHFAADAVLSRAAVDLAVARHVGRRERVVAREGEAWVHSGKDMRDTHTLIGTGGVFIHNSFAAYILTQGAATDDRVQALRPRKPTIFLDSSYLLYAVGLLSESRPDVAMQMFRRYITPAA